MENSLEYIIISNILENKDFAIKVIPYLKEEYFEKCGEIAERISYFFSKYSKVPTKTELSIEISSIKGLNEKKKTEIIEIIKNLGKESNQDDKWLLEKTEKFFQERAMANAVMDAAEIVTNHQEKIGSIIDLVKNALSVSFDANIGLDYFNDIERRYMMYHATEDKVSWGIKRFDEISGGGISKKNLVCAVAPTGAGKSLFMCSVAANVIRRKQNVLYISMEMSEDRVAERIDANLFGETIDSLKTMDEVEYKTRAEELKQKSLGRLIIREYPTSGANCNHFRNLLNELKNKQGFVPDLVIVDYLNICSSSRYSPSQTNSYGFIKAISEELRGLAVEFNCAVLTATQTNRQGINNSDIEMTEVSESIGTVFVLDMFFALIRTEALDESGQILVKQLKNRYSDLTKNQSFCLGVDRDRMTVFDLDGGFNMNNPINFVPKNNVSSNSSNDYGITF